MKKLRSEFLNVDLEMKSTSDPRVLLEELGRRVFQLHVDKIGRKHWVRLALARQPQNPTEAIRRFSRLLDDMSGRSKSVWAHATREFDIGVQGGFEPSSAEWVLDPEAVQAAARLGAQIRFTVYSPLLAIRAQKASRSS